MLPETRVVDVDLATTPILSTTTTNGNSFTLNAIQAGSDYFNRLGDRALLTEMRLNIIATCDFIANAAGDSEGNVLRTVAIKVKTPNGTIPDFADVFGETSNTGAVTTTFMDPIQWRRSSQYELLFDEVITANPMNSNLAAAGDVETQYFHIDERVPLHFYSRYDTSSNPAVYSDIQNNAVLLYFRAQTNSANTVWSINNRSYCRMLFVA